MKELMKHWLESLCGMQPEKIKNTKYKKPQHKAGVFIIKTFS
jgi:hypothetical protein